MKTDIYNHTGKVAGSIELPESIFGLEWNGDLVHQVAVAMQANARANTAHTKDRSEVSGGGRKPWKQKGTGQARHGSRALPGALHRSIRPVPQASLAPALVSPALLLPRWFRHGSGKAPMRHGR